MKHRFAGSWLARLLARLITSRQPGASAGVSKRELARLETIII